MSNHLPPGWGPQQLEAKSAVSSTTSGTHPTVLQPLNPSGTLYPPKYAAVSCPGDQSISFHSPMIPNPDAVLSSSYLTQESQPIMGPPELISNNNSILDSQLNVPPALISSGDSTLELEPNVVPLGMFSSYESTQDTQQSGVPHRLNTNIDPTSEPQPNGVPPGLIGSSDTIIESQPNVVPLRMVSSNRSIVDTRPSFLISPSDQENLPASDLVILPMSIPSALEIQLKPDLLDLPVEVVDEVCVLEDGFLTDIGARHPSDLDDDAVEGTENYEDDPKPEETVPAKKGCRPSTFGHQKRGYRRKQKQKQAKVAKTRRGLRSSSRKTTEQDCGSRNQGDKEGKHICSSCGICFRLSYQLTRHVEHSQDCSCNVCGQSFDSPCKLGFHLEVNTCRKPTSVSKRKICPKTEIRPKTKIRPKPPHRQTDIPKGKTGKCGLCQKTFRRASSFSKHNCIPMFKCEICGIAYDTMWKVGAHVTKDHTQHQCHTCSGSFGRISDLVNHRKLNPACRLRRSGRGIDVRSSNVSADPVSQGPNPEGPKRKKRRRKKKLYRKHSMRCDICKWLYSKRGFLYHKCMGPPPDVSSNDSLPKEENHVSMVESPEHGSGSIQPSSTNEQQMGDPPFTCEKCGQSFSEIQDLRLHQMDHKKVPRKRKRKVLKEKPLNQCRICKKLYSSKATLKVHLAVHSENTPYICVVCGKGAKRLKDLQVHEAVHLVECPFSCDSCGKGFKRKDTLKLHQRIHSDHKPYQCEQCGKLFRWSSGLQTHKVVHTDGKQFDCEVCGKKFVMKQTLRVHMKVHSRESHYQCEVCGKKFATQDYLARHKVVHSEDRPHQCDVCGKAFKRKDYLVIHRKVHTRLPKVTALAVESFPLGLCEKALGREETLEQHQKVHQEKGHRIVDTEPPQVVKTFPCDLCGKAFSRKETLKRHQKIHENGDRIVDTEPPKVVKTFPCDLCGKAYSRKETLKRHQKIHENGDKIVDTEPPKVVKSFPCDLCGKAYSRKESLKRHQQIHENGNRIVDTEPPKVVKTFPCDLCGKAYSRKETLKRHQKNHENGDRIVDTEPLKVVKTFPCDLCGNAYCRKETLKRHQKIHEEIGVDTEPPKLRASVRNSFPCNQCEKAFSRKVSLKHHQRVHEKNDVPKSTDDELSTDDEY